MNDSIRKDISTTDLPRMIPCPELTTEQIEIVTDLCFRKDDELQKADCFFVFGSIYQIRDSARKVREVLDRGLVENVILTGGIPNPKNIDPILKIDLSLNGDESEAEILLKAIGKEDYPDINFILDINSKNTLENARLGLELAEKHAIPLNKIMFLFRPQCAGRGYYSLKTIVPDAELLQVTSSEPTRRIDRYEWYLTDLQRNQVWGEVVRLKKYGILESDPNKKIDLPDEVKEILLELPIPGEL